jgi:hypothetical protein
LAFANAAEFAARDLYAAAANMSRHPVGEVLRELDRLGFIDLGYAQVTIRNATALRALVDG